MLQSLIPTNIIEYIDYNVWEAAINAGSPETTVPRQAVFPLSPGVPEHRFWRTHNQLPMLHALGADEVVRQFLDIS